MIDKKQKKNGRPFAEIPAGVYRNSARRTSAYVGQTWETTGADWRAAVTLGAVTGYSAMAVAPMAMPSASWRVGGQVWARVVFVPKPPRFGHASALHLAVEVGL